MICASRPRKRINAGWQSRFLGFDILPNNEAAVAPRAPLPRSHFLATATSGGVLATTETAANAASTMRGGGRLKNCLTACFTVDNQGMNMAVVWAPLGPKTPALQVPDYGGDMISW